MNAAEKELLHLLQRQLSNEKSLDDKVGLHLQQALSPLSVAYNSSHSSGWLFSDC